MIAIVSEDIPYKLYEKIKRYAKDIVLIKRYLPLYRAIQSHADIQCYPLDENILAVHPNLDGDTVKEFTSLGVEIIFGESQLEGHYPGDIPYNIGKVGNKLFHNLKYTDAAIKNFVADSFDLVHIRQGYGKCSIVPVGDKGIITPDGGIAKEGSLNGMSVCRIRQGYIDLPHMNFGFLGGASGVIPEENLVLFIGDISAHPDYRQIKAFLEKHQMEYICLGNESLLDIGSIYFL